MVSHHSAKICFLVAEKEDSRCCRFNPPKLFISKEHGMKVHGISYL